MKIAITGASGKTGYRISEEAVKKGYKVRQIIRKNSKVSAGLERLETVRVSLDKKGELDEASSSSPFLSHETLIVSKRSSSAETFEFFLMICLTLYPFLMASSEIL